MKARIPLTGKMKRDAYAEIRAQVTTETQKQSADQMRRFFKLAGVVLNDEFKFGKERISRFYSAIAELAKEAQADEIFWEHIDRQIIDRLGLEFERDWTR